MSSLFMEQLEREEIDDAPQYVFRFDEVESAESQTASWEDVRGLLGGKGANLGDMTRFGIPVPPGFTISTVACNAYLANDEVFPVGLEAQIGSAVAAVEQMTGKRFGDPHNPLLFSCRSGAKFSMPGMMDTVLNIGLNDEVVAAWIERTQDERFVYDAYRRLVQMFGSVVLDVPDELFEVVIAEARRKAGVETDAELSADTWHAITNRFKNIIYSYTGEVFPCDPHDQLYAAVEAVFASWNGKRAIDYRNASGIPHDLGTAVNIQTMVFGNWGEGSATGVAMSRNATTGEKQLEGDFLVNAQGEDVVAGIRLTQPISELRDLMPDIYDEFAEIAQKLERHYRNMQDMEFTVEHGKLWILQTRDGKRTAQAAVRIAVEMVEEGLIDRKEAVLRVQPAQIDFFMHPRFSADTLTRHRPIAHGLNVSPGAAVGKIALDADTAETWANSGEQVIMVRPETKPDDVHGMLAAAGILTSRGGRTSHAALVARQFGKPAVVGVEQLEIDFDLRNITIDDLTLAEGEMISLDGSSGLVYTGALPTQTPDITNPYLLKLLEWADDVRTLHVWANADYPRDAERAREYGAEGIGLCRTEHMFFETDRLPIMQALIMAQNEAERREALDALLPIQQADFAGIFRAMDGLPVVIRLIDPPLHEFLPSYDDLVRDLADLKVQLQHFHTLSEIDAALAEIRVKENYLQRVTTLREENPMLGTRGVRLGVMVPELIDMQVRAIFMAACAVAREGGLVKPEIMIPLTAHVNELTYVQKRLEGVANEVMRDERQMVSYKFGTMIEVPRAALTADELASVVDFFSFGTNDLTQMTYGVSRDDAERGFLVTYQQRGILPENPFRTLDQKGVGALIDLAVQFGRKANPTLEVGICGEHGGDPASIHFCHAHGLDYVSCSPFRVPVARLAAAHAALQTTEQ